MYDQIYVWTHSVQFVFWDPVLRNLCSLLDGTHCSSWAFRICSAQSENGPVAPTGLIFWCMQHYIRHCYHQDRSKNPKGFPSKLECPSFVFGAHIRFHSNTIVIASLCGMSNYVAVWLLFVFFISPFGKTYILLRPWFLDFFKHLFVLYLQWKSLHF